MKNRIKYCLNNECGGPNLENIISLGVAMGLVIEVYRVGTNIWEYYHHLPSTPLTETHDTGRSSIIVGYSNK